MQAHPVTRRNECCDVCRADELKSVHYYVSRITTIFNTQLSTPKTPRPPFVYWTRRVRAVDAFFLADEVSGDE
jgi:hypothetical protein